MSKIGLKHKENIRNKKRDIRYLGKVKIKKIKEGKIRIEKTGKSRE